MQSRAKSWLHIGQVQTLSSDVVLLAVIVFIIQTKGFNNFDNSQPGYKIGFQNGYELI
jgi:hypothetical protein